MLQPDVAIVLLTVEHLDEILSDERMHNEEHDDQGGQELRVSRFIVTIVPRDALPNEEGPNTAEDRHGCPEHELVVSDTHLHVVRLKHFRLGICEIRVYKVDITRVQPTVEGNDHTEQLHDDTHRVEETLDEVGPLDVESHCDDDHLHVVQ